MRWIAAGLVVAVAMPAAALADGIVGMSKDRLLACAGLPQQQMQEGGKTYWQYSASRTGAFVNGMFAIAKQSGCNAIVAMSGDRVQRVTYQKYGGWLPSEAACNDLFAGCRR